MTLTRHKSTPFPAVGLEGKIDSAVQPAMYFAQSGEVPASSGETPIGAARKAGRISDVWMSVGASGKDDSDQLCISGEVKIGGVSCLSTVPSISHVSGEASQAKTTKIAGDTGIIEAVINQATNIVAVGDIISVELVGIQRTAPTTEIANVVIVVEFEPVSDSPNAY